MNARLIGDRIKLYRSNLGWSQEHLAEAADVHTNTVKNIEAGQLTTQIDTLDKIAQALGVDLVALVQGASTKNNGEAA